MRVLRDRRYKTPMFQHRHYAAIAHAITQEPNTPHGAIRAMVRLFRQDNPNFNEGRFIAAAYGSPCAKDRRS